MGRTTRWLSCAAAGGLLFAASGCFVDTHDHDPIFVEATGTLTVRWLVESTADPFACYDNFASDLELAIYDPRGGLWTVEYAACDAFGVSIVLPPGDYSVDGTLLDVNGVPVSTTVTFDVRVAPHTEAVVDLDFPSDSML